MKKEPSFTVSSDFDIYYNDYPNGGSMRRGHYHNVYEIMYFPFGKRRMIIAENEYLLEAGDAIIIEPYIKHQTLDYEDNPSYSRWFLAVNPELFLGIYSQQELRRLKNIISTQILHFEDIDEMCRRFEEINENFLSSASLKKRLTVPQTILLIDYMLRAADNIKLIKIDREQIPSKEIIDVLQYIEGHYTEEITHDRLCSELHISKSTLYRKFTRSVGLPLKQYIIHKRAIMASKLLVEKRDMSISEIASACGVTSLALTRIIKEHYGKTPREVRKYGA